jgi:hypothetical protein
MIGALHNAFENMSGRPEKTKSHCRSIFQMILVVIAQKVVASLAGCSLDELRQYKSITSIITRF